MKNKLFTIITEEPARIEWCARKHCLIRTGTEDNITNTIYGIDPMRFNKQTKSERREKWDR